MELVCTRVIQAAVVKETEARNCFHEVFFETRRQGIAYVNKKYPYAVYRQGCNCCYPDGPDIVSDTQTLDNGDVKMDFYVDHEWSLVEHCG